MDTYKLTYFNKRGGGEIVRLVLVAAGKQFQDDRIDTDKWQLVKHQMPMKGLPVLHVNKNGTEITYCQSGAISRYLARTFDLHGTTNETSMVIDEIYDSVGDVRSHFVQIHFCKDAKRKMEHQNTLIGEILPTFCEFLEKRMKQFGERGYIVGSKLTLADLAVFNMVDSAMEMGLGSLWQPHPILTNHRQHVLTNELITKWVDTRPKTEL